MYEIVGFFLLLFFLWLLGSAETPKQYGIKTSTLKGEEVKSRAEGFIADYFNRNNINYEYERKAESKGFIFSKEISHPDFYLPDYDVYVEYWGLVDADDKKVRSNYVRIMKWKMKQYYDNDIKFISIYPRNLKNLDWIFKKKFEDVVGKKLG